MFQAIYEAADSRKAGAWIFFGSSDFWEESGLVHHELGRLEVHLALSSMIAAFLTNRQQAVRIGVTVSDWKTLKGSTPRD